VSDRFEEIRTAIDATDLALVGLVNERLRLVAELWEIKRSQGIDHVDPGRERALRAALAAANDGPLSDEGLDRLVTELLALTKREVGGRP
jgi:3-deoxy-7-phosphoheptulonate synthase / chorismate mutase